MRPTADRVRETLFNFLTPYIDGAACLDLFAGSGALGLEAVSRGARCATLVEKDRQTYLCMRNEVKNLGASNIKTVKSSAAKFLHSCKKQYDIVFLDPPFHSDLLGKTLKLLAGQEGLLSDRALIYAEHEASTCVDLPGEDWAIHRKIKGAATHCTLMIRTASRGGTGRA